MNFNSIKVRLEQTLHLQDFTYQGNFNSIKVRLELVLLSLLLKLIHHFNSIKVRLEPTLRFILSVKGSEFQFHKGTIRTNLVRHSRIVKTYFNSIKVRLEH